MPDEPVSLSDLLNRDLPLASLAAVPATTIEPFADKCIRYDFAADNAAEGGHHGYC
jgi:hypothetical protein